MQSKSKRSRILVLGALVGSVLSIGVSAGSASAWSRTANTSNESTVVVVNSDIEAQPYRAMSGIRW